jgi:cytochrome c553
MLMLVGVIPQAMSEEAFPDWAFPDHPGAESPPSPDRITVPGSAVRAVEADLDQIDRPVDWFPAEHPVMPPVVGHALKPDAWACGYCHLPNGAGRPENASLAGLPAAYIIAQVDAFRTGARRSARADWRTTGFMIGVAKTASDPEVEAAAHYFSALPFRSHVRVVEAATVPHHEVAGFIDARTPGPEEAIGERIVEMPDNLTDFERRDPHASFRAYVPPGSIERGERLAVGGAQPCATCHGEGRRGGESALGPPLAGRSPSYLFRQLYGFRSGARADAGAEVMRGVVGGLTRSQMIDLAAYAASRHP